MHNALIVLMFICTCCADGGFRSNAFKEVMKDVRETVLGNIGNILDPDGDFRAGSRFSVLCVLLMLCFFQHLLCASPAPVGGGGPPE